jgi:hypothetical protein
MKRAPDLMSRLVGIGGGGGDALLRVCGATWCCGEVSAGSPTGNGAGPKSGVIAGWHRRWWWWCVSAGIRGHTFAEKIERDTEGRPVE